MKRDIAQSLFICLIALFLSGGCDSSNSTDQASSSRLDGRADVTIHAVENAGEFTRIEFRVENKTDSRLEIRDLDIAVESDTGESVRPESGPVSFEVPVDKPALVGVAVDLPTRLLVSARFGDEDVPIPADILRSPPDAPAESKPTGKGIHRLELDDEDKK